MKKRRVTGGIAGQIPKAQSDSGLVIASRCFHGHPDGDLELNIRAPCAWRDAFRCSFDVILSGSVSSFEVYGGDSLQALQIAIKAAGMLIEAGNSTIRWDGAWNGNLGFPREFPDDLPPPLQRKLDVLLAIEVSSYREGSASDARRSFSESLARAKKTTP